MNEQLSYRIQYWCAWTGIAFVVLYGFTWVVMGHNYPPPDPKFSSVELVNNFYIQYRDRILLGQALSACFGLLYAVWSVQLTIQMWKREKAPILAMINLMGGTLTGWVLIFCPVLWVWCAEFAGQADPELVKTVHFIGWYVYDMTYMITTVQGFAIGALVFLDKEKPALMPKWAAAFAVFVGASFFPLTFLPYFKDGIFAINGYWSFHTAFIGYGLFIVIVNYYMFTDLKKTKISAPQGLGQAITNKHF